MFAYLVYNESITNQDYPKGGNHMKKLTTYNKLNTVSQAICDSLTSGWYLNGEFSNPSDLVSMHLFATESINKALEMQLDESLGYSAIEVSQAILSRYYYAVENAGAISA
jgi:hypothetical protein